MSLEEQARLAPIYEAARLREENERLRAALQSLYDATQDYLATEDGEQFDKALAAAGVVLGGGNE